MPCLHLAPLDLAAASLREALGRARMGLQLGHCLLFLDGVGAPRQYPDRQGLPCPLEASVSIQQTRPRRPNPGQTARSRFGTQFQLRRSPVRFAAVPLAPPPAAHYCQNDGSPLDRSRNPPLVRSRHCRAGPGAPCSGLSPPRRPHSPAASLPFRSAKTPDPAESPIACEIITWNEEGLKPGPVDAEILAGRLNHLVRRARHSRADAGRSPGLEIPLERAGARARSASGN